VCFSHRIFLAVMLYKRNFHCTDQARARGRGTWHDMLRSPFMWLISLSYLMVFLGRTATLDWAQLYLVQDLGHNQYVGVYCAFCA